MASIRQKALTEIGTHGVCYISSMYEAYTKAGANFASEAIDNGTLVQLKGYEEKDGEMVSVYEPYDSTTDKEAYLVCNRKEGLEDEPAVNCWIDTDEQMTIYDVCKQLRSFGVANVVTLNGALTADDIKLGFVAHYDSTTKKFIISDPTTPNAGYAGAKYQFVVVGVALEEEGQGLYVDRYNLAPTKVL